MDALRQDLRYAVRSLLSAPGFTVIVLLTLALGIGANTAIFTVVSGVLLRPLPYPEPDRLIRIWETSSGGKGTVAGPNFLDWRERAASFEHLAASRMRFLTVVGGGEPEEVAAAMVSANFFEALGVAPARGRAFSVGEDQGLGSVAVLSDAFWRTRFGGDPTVVGRGIVLGGRSYTVVGIAPSAMIYPSRTQVWVPLELGVDRAVDRTSHSYDVIGRLAPGVSLERAQSELDAIARDLAVTYPVSNAGRGVSLLPLMTDTVGPVRPALLMVGGAVAFVLLIACANVANLFLARASTRQRELAVRAALGAGRWRLARQVLVEAVLLATAGGALGLLLGAWGVDLLLALRPRGIPRLQEISVDAWVLLFTLAVSVLVGVGFGLFPAISLSSNDPADSFRGESRGASQGARRVRFRRALVIAQVSLALILVAGAALLVVTVRRLTAVEPGFDPGNALTFQLSLPAARFPEPAGHAAFVDRVVARLEQVPGAEHAGGVYYLPLGSADVSGDFTVEGTEPPGPGREPYAGYRIVSGRYFQALGVMKREGRLFGPEDRAGSPPVAIINQTLARRYVPGGNPIGKRITFGDGKDEPVWREIVGVVADVRHSGLTIDPGPEIYVPLHQLDPNLWTVFRGMPLSVVVRGRGAVERLAPPIKAAVREIDPEQPVSQLQPADDLMAAAMARQRFSMVLLLAFAGLALTLAAVGVYGVMAYTVSQRRRELGIRLALGARPSSVQGMVLRQGLGMAAGGIVVGLIGALLLGRLLAGLLYGVRPTDPVVLGAVATLLALASGLACLVPAVRATRVNPVDALRSD